jgi:hypothetical protein
MIISQMPCGERNCAQGVEVFQPALSGGSVRSVTTKKRRPPARGTSGGDWLGELCEHHFFQSLHRFQHTNMVAAKVSAHQHGRCEGFSTPTWSLRRFQHTNMVAALHRITP